MTLRVGINGFGRMGRLGLRAAWGWDELEFAHINEMSCDAGCSAHLLKFDSVHGRWDRHVGADAHSIIIDDQAVGYSSVSAPSDVDWMAAGVDLIIEASGAFRSLDALQVYLDQGVKKVVVAAPVPGVAQPHAITGYAPVEPLIRGYHCGGKTALTVLKTAFGR